MSDDFVMNEEHYNNNNEINFKKFKREILFYCSGKSNIVISFPPSKIISEELFFKYYLWLRKILLTQEKDNVNNNIIEQQFQKYLNYLNFNENIQYNNESISEFMEKFKKELIDEHKDHIEIKQNIQNYWYYVILEMLLFQVMIPTMNHISNKLTLNYYFFENEEKVRNLKFLSFMLKDYCDIVDTCKTNGLKKEINDEILRLNKMVSLKQSFSNCNYNTTTSTPLIQLYSVIVKGKQDWYNSSKFPNQDKDEYNILIDFKGLHTNNQEKECKECKELRLSLNFFFSVFIANRILISPLSPRNEQVDFPYEFNINNANVSKFAFLHGITATKYDKELKQLILKNNFPDIYGMYELVVSCFLNNSICYIDLSRCSIDQNILKGFEIGLKDVAYFQDEKNFVNINYLDLSHNTLKGETLSNIIELIPQIKTLILNDNPDVKNKKEEPQLFAYLFNKLEKLYRQKKCFLQNLFLVKCNLNKYSLHALGKLIKSRNCGIKLLALNKNEFDRESEIEFSKKLKFNMSINELYLSETNFCGENNSDLLNLLPNTFIRKLYLNKNSISSNNALKLIAQTQIDKEIFSQTLTPTTINIDLSEQKKEEKNTYNYQQIELLEKIITNSGLKMLDLMGIYSSFKNFENHDKLKKLKESLSDKILKFEENGFIILC